MSRQLLWNSHRRQEARVKSNRIGTPASSAAPSDIIAGLPSGYQAEGGSTRCAAFIRS